MSKKVTLPATPKIVETIKSVVNGSVPKMQNPPPPPPKVGDK